MGDKLMAEYKDSTTVLIADVDCTAGGKDLCNEVGVRGYPTIKSGDPSDLQDYKGGRSFDDLKKHAETLGPTCGPAHLDLCDEDKKKAIAEYVALGAEKREAMIKEKDGEIAKLESDFKAFVDGLQRQYTHTKRRKRKTSSRVKSVRRSARGVAPMVTGATTGCRIAGKVLRPQLMISWCPLSLLRGNTTGEIRCGT